LTAKDTGIYKVEIVSLKLYLHKIDLKILTNSEI